METVKVDILNPKARKLLKDLADLDLIAIRKSTKSELEDLLETIDEVAEFVNGSSEMSDCRKWFSIFFCCSQNLTPFIHFFHGNVEDTVFEPVV